MLSHSAGYVEIGNSVTLTRDTIMDKSGKLGVVTRKYAPAHCCGAWSITVKWDGNNHETSYPYPNGIVARVDR